MTSLSTACNCPSWRREQIFTRSTRAQKPQSTQSGSGRSKPVAKHEVVQSANLQSAKCKLQTANCKAQTAKHEVVRSAKCKVRGTEHRAESKYLRAQRRGRRAHITDHRPQTTDRRPQTTDHRPQTTEHARRKGASLVSLPQVVEDKNDTEYLERKSCFVANNK